MGFFKTGFHLLLILHCAENLYYYYYYYAENVYYYYYYYFHTLPLFSVHLCSLVLKDLRDSDLEIKAQP